MKTQTLFSHMLLNENIGVLLQPQQLKYGKILSMIVTLFAANNVLYFTPGFFGILYYIFLIFFTILAFCGGGRVKLNIEMWFLYTVCWLSILSNDIPAIFRAEYRCVTFILMTLLLSPALTSDFLAYFRVQLFQYLVKVCIVITVLSFIGRFIGISIYLADTGLWCGITAHPMLLGPIAGISTITLFYELLSQKFARKISLYWRIFALVSSIYCLLGAASRTSIIATFVSILIIAIKKGSIQKMVSLIFIGFVILTFSFSFTSSVWENVSKKNRNETTLNFDSRTSIWKQRLSEFQQNPFSGIGFSSIEDGDDGSSNVASSGTIEPGSSWLMILSTMGIMGALSFLLLVNNTLVRLSQQKDNAILMFALSIFWALEMCAEGFIFASGSFLFFLLWNLIGAIEGITHFTENSVAVNEKQ